jgi:superfamily II DNA or RNA helicase
MGKGSGSCKKTRAALSVEASQAEIVTEDAVAVAEPVVEEIAPEPVVEEPTPEPVVEQSLEMQLLDSEGDDDEEEDDGKVSTLQLDPKALKEDKEAWKKKLAEIKKQKALEAEKRRKARDKLLGEVLAESGEGALESINPLALQVKLVEGTNVDDPQVMLKKCVSVRMVVNPVFDAVMQKLGAVKKGKRNYAFYANPDASQDNFSGILRAIPPRQAYPKHQWDNLKLGKKGGHSGGSNAHTIRGLLAETSLGKQLSVKMSQSLQRDSGHYDQQGANHGAVTISLKDNEVNFKVMTQPDSLSKETQLYPDAPNLHTMRENDLKPGQRVTPPEALSLVGAAESKGIRTVVDPRIEQLGAIADKSVLVRPVPGSPGKAELLVGGNAPLSKQQEKILAKLELEDVAGGWGGRKITLPAQTAADIVNQGESNLMDPVVEDILRMQSAKVIELDGLMPHQNEVVALHRATKIGFLNAMSPGLGKGHPVDTNILTPHGWQRLGNLIPGDQVIGSDGNPTEVLQVFDRGELPVYRVGFNDGSSVLCDEDHVWTTYSRKKRPDGSKRQARNLDVRYLKDNLLGKDGEISRLKFHIPLVKPVNFSSEEPRLIPAYSFGVLLGEGSFEKRELTFSSGDEEIFERVSEDLGDRVKLMPKLHKGKCPARRISCITKAQGNYVREALRAYDLEGKRSWEKFIPEAYLHAPVEERIALLQGLCDSDGHACTSGAHLEYSTSSPHLASDIKFLAQSLGGNVHTYPRIPTYTYKGEKREGRLSYRVYIHLPKEITPFRLQRKVDAYQYPQFGIRRMMKSIVAEGTAEVRCLKVAAGDELYVTEDFLVTHNTPSTLTGCQEKWRDKEKDTKDPYRAIVSAGKSLLDQWKDESGKFFPGSQIFALSTTNIDKLRVKLEEHESADPRYPLVVTASYAAVAKATPLLLRYRWDDMVIDEAAFLKNTSSQRTEAFWAVRDQADCAIALTGTPIDRGLDDVGSILSWVRNDKSLFSTQKLSQRYDVTNEAHLKDFLDTMGPTLFRRDNSVIADQLPRLKTQILAYDPHVTEKALADGARKELKAMLVELEETMQKQIEKAQKSGKVSEEEIQELNDSIVAMRGATLGGIVLARQAASDPKALEHSESVGAALLDEKGLIEPAIKHGGTKRANISDYVKKRVDTGNPAIIFTEFTSLADSLIQELEEKGVRVGTVQGKTSEKNRNVARHKFQGVPCEHHHRRSGAVKDCKECTQPELDVLVLTRAAKEGLNLQRANTMIHYDLSWVPSDFVQRTGRAHRFGSEHEEVEVSIALMKGTIEERVGAVLVPRAMQALMALDGARGADISQSSLSGLSQELSNTLGEEETAGDNASIFKLAKDMVLNDK